MEKGEKTSQIDPPPKALPAPKEDERKLTPKKLEISERIAWMMENLGTFSVENAAEKFNLSKKQIYEDLKEIREVHTQSWPDDMAHNGYVYEMYGLDNQLKKAMEELWKRVQFLDGQNDLKTSQVVSHMLGEIKNIAYARKELIAGGSYKGVQNMVKDIGGFSKET